jgi:2-oxoglutarate dehydrogenase complex dehydrogenase (E1) component-like enzyme
MAEKKKKKKIRGMPSGSIKSRMPSKSAKGQAGKKAVVVKKTVAAKPAKKRSLMERINPFDKESKERRANKRMAAGKRAKGTGLVSTKKSRVKAIGAKAGTKVQRGAVKKVSTKGGDYVKYKKKSKAAGSFRSAFKSGCAKGAKGFSWDGRSYSCAKAGSPKKTKAVKKTTSPAKKPIARGGQGGSSPE